MLHIKQFSDGFAVMYICEYSPVIPTTPEIYPPGKSNANKWKAETNWEGHQRKYPGTRAS